MFYNLLTLQTKPGNRLASFDYLREVAEWLTENKKVPAIGITNVSGPIYEVGLISLYESMAHYDQINRENLQDQWFNDWFERAGKAVKWKTLVSHVVRVFRRTEMMIDVQLLAIYSMNIIPGVRLRGVDHLIQLANHLETTYKLPAEVTADEEGYPYRHHLSILFENLGGYEELAPRMLREDWYGKWFKDAHEFMDPTSMTLKLARRV